MIHCLHGAVGNAKSWDLFKNSFGEEIIPHDLWNLFKNQSPSLQEAGKTIADQASQNDIILGYSMGGRLALHALLSSPKKWRAAIIISAHPGLIEHQEQRLATDKQWAELALNDWEDFLSQWNSQSILPKVPQGLEPPLRKDQSAIAQSFHQWSLGRQRNLRPQLKNITCPTLWITGQDDEKFTSLGAATAASLPLVTHTAISKCGHRAPWEQPQQFAQTVRNFLQNI